MFDRFTDRANKVLALARNEAQHFNSECISTEHLLLALLVENNGLAAHAMKNFGITQDQIRNKMGVGRPTVAIGKLPLTRGTKAALTAAVNQAFRFGHSYIGTEHLLLGLMEAKTPSGVPDSVATQILEKLGYSYEQAHKDIMELLYGDDVPMHPHPGESPDAAHSRNIVTRDRWLKKLLEFWTFKELTVALCAMHDEVGDPDEA